MDVIHSHALRTLMDTRMLVSLLLILLLVLPNAGCVSVHSLPHEVEVDNRGEVVQCSKVFPRWEMQADMIQLNCGGLRDEGLGLCVAMYLSVPVVSSVVSGSVYLVGNTLHWTEKTARCGSLPFVAEHRASVEEQQ